VNKYEQRTVNKYDTEKMKHCLIFSREIFYVTIVLCLNIISLKAVDEITARQTRTSFVNTKS